MPDTALPTTAAEPPNALSEGVFLRAHLLIRRLVWVYGLFAVVSAGCLALAWTGLGGRAAVLARLAVAAGLGAIVLPAVLLALCGLGATWLLTAARLRPEFAAGLRQAQAFGATTQRGAGSPGFAARVGQGVAWPVGAALIGLAIWGLWPGAPGEVAGGTGLLAAFLFAMAFMSLVAERIMGAVAAPLLPEAPGLRRLLLLTTVLLAVAGGVAVGRGAGLDWVRWVGMAAAVLPGLVAAELALRAAARLFLPAPANERATAMVDSIAAALVTGGAQAPGRLLRTHLGVDFARSWALGFVARATLPAVLLTALLCWGLSGLKLVDLDARGVYERLGAPVAVLGPGLHLLLPWPLGRLRPVELGTIHTIAVGSDAPPEAGDQIGAEANPPATANRLWETAHATEVNYLVASQSGAVQSFQLVSTELLVLYRTGLTRQDALDAVYGAADQPSVVRQAAARLATRFFGRHTLEAVMGDQPQTLSDELRRALAADVARAHAGIEILGVVIAEIHPPAGAAAAYHRVQAAEIDANASISNEIGRATRMRGQAGQEAHQMQDAADATAAEALGTARAASYRFGADRAAYATGPVPFLLERRLAVVGSALAQTPLTLVDHRLGVADGPLLDLRAAPVASNLAGDLAGVGMPPAAAVPAEKTPEAAAGTFTYVTPNSTADTTPPTPDAQDATPGTPP